ncbi:MAG TPA: alpha-mannosidase, partial [Actinomycetes bacterium]|nr:alpha-mannosidase [Actinomycetes bacterium]
MRRDRERRRRLLHMIGNAHIDPVWLWRWPEGLAAVLTTFRSVVERMREHPELRFTCDSVAQLAWVSEADPELFEEIRRRVAEGRWELAGGWWVEPDCNLPCGESFVRQGLYGQRWLLERFGGIATVGCNVDPFGHNATLPQILRSSGMDAYLFLRPGPHELELPGPAFWWRSPDGSSVLAYRIPHEYQTVGTGLDEHVRAAVAQFPPDWEELACLYGVGNHGGGPTRANLDSIRRMSESEQPARLECSTARRFFDRLLERRQPLPVVAGELQHHAVGCYSAHAAVKRWNRRAENLLLAAEKWTALAAVVAGTRPAVAELGHAWRQVLFNQFHDLLAGTAIEEAYEDARDQLGEAAAIAGRAANRAMRAISGRVAIEPEPGMTPLVVLNPHAWPVRADVEVEVEVGPSGPPTGMADERGRSVPVQTIRPSATVPGWRRRLVFPAELPPLGYRTYRLYAGGRAGVRAPGAAGGTATSGTPGGAGAGGLVAAGSRGTRRRDAVVLERGGLRVEVDPATGWLASLVEVGSGAELLAEDAGPHAVVLADTSDTWSHGILAYGDEVGAFAVESLRLLE